MRDRAGLLEAASIYGLIAIVVSVTSIYLGSDATPDFRIYHFYNGFSAVTGGRSQDIAAAQLQTYLFPGVDAVIFYLTTTFNGHPWLLRVILAFPATVAGWAIAGLVAEYLGRRSGFLMFVCAIFGLWGATNLATLGTTMSELFSGVFILWALVFVSKSNFPSSCFKAIGPGILCGIAAGLKLTAMPAVAGVAIMIAVLSYPNVRDITIRLGIFCAAVICAFAVVAGWWWLKNYSETGNPIFPYFNDIFQSELVSKNRWDDNRFKPTSLMMWIFYPVYWAFRKSTLVSELPMRDARLLLCVSSAIVLAALSGWRLINLRPSEPAASAQKVIALSTFVLVTYFGWEFLFSIYRYVAVLEAVSGVVLLVLCVRCFDLNRKTIVGLLAILSLVAATTRFPWWSRSTPDSLAVRVEVPASVEPNSMVLMLDPYALSYIVPSLPPSVSVVGANTNLVRPGSPGTLQARIEQTIHDHAGPIWGLENPKDFIGVADQTLSFYKLARSTTCSKIKSNIEDDRVLICKLERRSG